MRSRPRDTPRVRVRKRSAPFPGRHAVNCLAALATLQPWKLGQPIDLARANLRVGPVRTAAWLLQAAENPTGRVREGLEGVIA
jgi:hypothetical protein